MEAKDKVLRHRRPPGGGRQYECVACTCFLSIDVEFLGLSRRLRARAGNDQGILEAVLVKGLAGEADGLLSLIMREVLGFAVGTLDEDPGDSSLGSDEI